MILQNYALRRFVSFVLAFTILFGMIVTGTPAAEVSANAAEAGTEISLPAVTPKGLAVLPLSLEDKKLTLVWSKPENYSNIQYYTIYENDQLIGRSDQNKDALSQKFFDKFYGDPANSEMVKASMHNYVVTGLSPETQYRFAVKAVDQNGGEIRLNSKYETVITTNKTPKIINIKDSGFEAIGDGTRVNTKAIQKAIDDCPKGGTVLVPDGTFQSGSLYLKSNMTLKVDGTLLGSENADDYPYSNPKAVSKSAALINSKDKNGENIRIVGKGVIDGNGWKEDSSANDPDNFFVSMESSQKTVEKNGVLAASQYKKAISSYGFSETDAYSTRSNLIEMRGIHHLYIGDGLTLKNPAQHTETNGGCSDVVLNSVKLETFNCNNGDGTGLAGGKGLVVVNSVLDTGDDNIAFNAGRGKADTQNPSTSDIWIFNNYFGRGHGAVVCGSYTAAWIEKILAEDNILNGTGTGLRCKSSKGTGGGARSIVFRDTAMKNLTDNGGQPFIFTSNYNGGTVSDPAEEAPVFQNILVQNCSVDGAKDSAIFIEGLPEKSHKQIQFKNVSFKNTKPASIHYFENGVFDNVVFDSHIKNPWDIQNATGLKFTGKTTMSDVSKNAADPPAWKSSSALSTTNLSNDTVSLCWQESDASDNTGVVQYVVYQNGAPAAVLPLGQNSYTAVRLKPSTKYSFKVEAMDATGATSSTGPSAQVTTTELPTERFYAPDDLRAAPASTGSNSTVLVWEKPANYSKVTDYAVYNNGRLIGTTRYTYFKASGLAPNTNYTFTVKARKKGGFESPAGNPVTVHTQPESKLYNVKDYGAKGDGTVKDTKAIQKAIDACPTGGTVYLPDGVYLSGALNLHSDMTFYVDAGAQLKPSTDLKDYPFTNARHDIEDIYRPDDPFMGNPAFGSLLNAGTMDHTKGTTTHNIRIAGPGTIGDENNGLKLREEYESYCAERYKQIAATGVSQDDINTKYHMGGGSLISLKNCDNVYMDGIHIRNGMMWTVVPVYCDKITAYGLDINTTVHNGDGFDPNSTTNTYILGTQFSTGDDCSAVKSGKDKEGRDIGRPSHHIYYRGVLFNAGHGGITIGSEMSGGISDVYGEDCTLVPVDVQSSAVNPGVRVKVSPSRGGYIRNLQLRDSVCNKISVITNYDKQKGATPGVTLPDISNFQFTNITAPNSSTNGDNMLDLNGSDFGKSSSYLRNLQFTNCDFHHASLNTCENIFFNNCRFAQPSSKTNCVNVQEGIQNTDDAKPKDVSQDFEGGEAGAALPDGWTLNDGPAGKAEIKAENGNHYLSATDTGTGYVTVTNRFDAQSGDVTVKFRFRFPSLSSACGNSIFALKDAGNKVIAQFPLQFSGNAASLAKEKLNSSREKAPVVPEVKNNEWYPVKIILHTDTKKVEVYNGDEKVTFPDSAYEGYYDPAAGSPSAFEFHAPNNNKDEVVMDVDDFSASCVKTPQKIPGLKIKAARNFIADKNGKLPLLAEVSPADAADKSVSWSVKNPDFTDTKTADIDKNGVVTAVHNGSCIAVATLNADQTILGVLPLTITGQDSEQGYAKSTVSTAIGKAPVLSDFVYLTYSDGSVVPYRVAWDAVSPAQYSRAGTFTVSGTVRDTSKPVQAAVTVETRQIHHVLPVSVKAAVGKLALPSVIPVVYNDGAKASLPVIWDAVSSQLFSRANIPGFSVTGKIKGTNCTATASVSVLPTIVPNVSPIVVAQDGTGDFRTIGEAIQSIPANNQKRRVVFIKNGIYDEKLVVDRPYVTLAGESANGTRITYNDSPMKEDENGKHLGTFNDFTLQVTGRDFTAQDLTVENVAGSTVGQCVAVDLDADRARFTNCRLLGFQDTLLTRNGTDTSSSDNVPDQETTRVFRSYFNKCYISGSVDFIFGAGKAVFNECEIHSRLSGYVTAASTPAEQDYGYVFLNCKLTAESLLKKNAPVKLGRPWRPYSAVSYINCAMDSHISAFGWDNWGKTANETTARYCEYNTVDLDGKPLDLSKRAPWAKLLTQQEAQTYTAAGILSGSDQWDASKISVPDGSSGSGDFSKLQKLIDEFKKFIKGGYTESSWNDFLGALNFAESVLNNEYAEQSEIEEAMEALLSAKNGLAAEGGSHHSGHKSSDTGKKPDTSSPAPAKKLKSDTTAPYQFHGNSAYFYKITTSDSVAPKAVSTNPSAVTVELVKKLPDGYLYRIVPVGDGSATIITTAGNGETTSFAAHSVNCGGLISDTPYQHRIKAGASYQFKFTLTSADKAPVFSTGNSKMLQTVSVFKQGNAYYFKVKTVGKGSTGIYVTLPGQKTMRKCVLTVS